MGRNDLCDLFFANRTLGFVNAPVLMQRLVAPLQKNSVNVRVYEEKRDLFYGSLKSFGYEVVKPQGAFYSFEGLPLRMMWPLSRPPIETDLDRSREGFRETGLFQNLLCCRK